MRILMFLFLLVSACDDEMGRSEQPDLAVRPVGAPCGSFPSYPCAAGLKCCFKRCDMGPCGTDGEAYCEPDPPPPGFGSCDIL